MIPTWRCIPSCRSALAAFGHAVGVGLQLSTAVGVVLIWVAVSERLAASPRDDEARPSLIGNYLAGRFARAEHDAARAAGYYQSALDLSGGDSQLLENTFQMETASGRWPRAVPLAGLVADANPKARMAQTLLALDAVQRGDYKAAQLRMEAAAEGPIGELTSALGRAWIAQAGGDTTAALAAVDALKPAEWAQFYVAYHRALIADQGGRYDEARVSFERVFRQDTRSLRTALAYAHSLAAVGDTRLAQGVLKDHMDRQQGDGHPLARDLRERIQRGERVGLLVRTPADGLAEMFYGLGEALAGEGGVTLGVTYLQLALFLVPEHPFALAALANAYEGVKRFEAANTVYDRVPRGTPLEVTIEIRRAFNLNALERVDEAKAVLDRLIDRDPTDLRPLEAIGNVLRTRKRFAEAITYYDKAIALIPNPEKRHWTYFYSRGTCYERTKNWPKAELDLQKALALFPDQPLALNYLGYTWVDQGMNLQEGLAMIERAVAQRPDDGYIVDSLGWAHYKLGDFPLAVRYLERAVELKPEDPTLNDHLGDALWRVGRTLEAQYQWEQALTLKPEPDEIDKIRAKVTSGLPPLVKTPEQALQRVRQTIVDTQRRRAQAGARRPASESTPEGNAVVE